MGIKQNKIEKHQPRSSAGAQTGDAHERPKAGKNAKRLRRRTFCVTAV